MLQRSDEVQVFTTDVIPVSFDEEIALDNFTFFFFFFAVNFKVHNSTSLFSFSYDGELLQLISEVITQRQRVHFQQLSGPGRYVVGLNPRPSTKHRHIARFEARLVQHSQIKKRLKQTSFANLGVSIYRMQGGCYSRGLHVAQEKKPQTLQSCAPSKKNICDFTDIMQREHSTRFIPLSRCYRLILASSS